VNNLADKVKKAALKKALFGAFSAHGRVVAVVASKTADLRGQAWVSFADVPAAAAALRALQGFPLYDKPLRIAFAREASDRAAAAAPGAAGAPPRAPRAKRAREGEGEGAGDARGPKRARGAAGGGAAGGAGGGAGGAAGGGAAGGASGGAPPAPAAAPSRTLLVQNLPAGVSGDALAALLKGLFGRFPGLTGVRPVEARRLAFVDYESPSAAMPALHGLHGFAVAPGAALTVSYAR